jgi:O-antigen/teichoic acid export membrane protein
LGFGATLTRRISFIMGKTGSDQTVRPSREAQEELATLIATGRHIYRILAIATFIVTFGAGIFSIKSLRLSGVPFSTVWIAWGVLCLSQALSVWASVWTCLLQGIGYVGWDALVAALVSVLTLCIQIAVAALGGGLIGLAIVAACGSITQRLLIVAAARRKRADLLAIRGRTDFGLIRDMLPVALKGWITSIGLAVVLSSDQFFIAGLQGPAKIPAYRASYILFLNLNMLAITFASSSAVFIARFWQAGELQQVHRLVTRNLRLGLSIIAGGGACVLGLGERLFNVWVGQSNYIGPTIAILFFVLLFLEAQAFILATSSRATEDEAFASWAVAAAAIKVALSLYLGKRFGLVGIIIGTLVAQLLTNHWFMCYRALRRLRMSPWKHISGVIVPVSILFAATFGIVRSVANMLVLDWRAVCVGVAVTGILFSGTVWLLVLEAPERRRAIGLAAGVLGMRATTV